MERLFNKILCPIDFSDLSALAVKKAASISVMMGAELYIAHIIIQNISGIYGNALQSNYTDKGLIASVAEQANEFVNAHIKDVKYEVLVTNDVHIYSGILDLTERNNIDLIIMATHGRRGFRRRILGSATEAVIRHADCSVLAIKH